MKTTVDGFVRDPNSGAVINTDNEALRAYKLKKNKFREIDEMKQKLVQFDNLRHEVKEIKDMIKELMEKVSK